MKIRLVAPEFFHVGGRTVGQTYMRKLVVVFCNLGTRLKINNESDRLLHTDF
jgi:hypothetical protein